MPNKIPYSELKDKIFGRLTIIGDSLPSFKNRMLLVRCKCGTEKRINISYLRNGSIVSCGCKIREETIIRNTTHGLSRHPLNRIWRAIRERCYDEKHISYKWYGAKGVTVCEEWRNNFMSFYNWAICNGYKNGLLIDRIKNELGYSPNNCKWSTPLESSRNTTANRLIEYNGEIKCVAEWAEILNIPRSRLSDRLNKLNWSINDAFTKTKQV